MPESIRVPYDLTCFLSAQAPVIDAVLACTRAVLAHGDKTAHEIFGSPDDLKFRSCMTLFALAGPQHPEFRQALELFHGGEPDPLTVRLLI